MFFFPISALILGMVGAVIANIFARGEEVILGSVIGSCVGYILWVKSLGRAMRHEKKPRLSLFFASLEFSSEKRARLFQVLLMWLIVSPAIPLVGAMLAFSQIRSDYYMADFTTDIMPAVYAVFAVLIALPALAYLMVSTKRGLSAENMESGTRVVVGQCDACGKDLRVKKTGVRPKMTLTCKCGVVTEIGVEGNKPAEPVAEPVTEDREQINKHPSFPDRCPKCGALDLHFDAYSEALVCWTCGLIADEDRE
jgi:ssDNA-binding Zn-finger/Zn-ribbon topoisomerase 1